MEKPGQNNARISTDFPEAAIAHVRMLDEQGKNCLSPAFVSELTAHFRALQANENVKVVLLSGLPGIFCGGADLDTLRQLTENRVKPADIVLPKTILDIPAPVIAAMEGHAVGGGFALGLCADIVLLAEESRYGCSFMNMGFTPGMGMTRLLEHYMAPAIAHELQYTGANVRGSELKGKTNFNYILPKKELMPAAMALAQAIAEKPAHSLRLLKKYLAMSRRKMFEETYAIESMMHELSFNRAGILKTIEENYVR